MAISGDLKLFQSFSPHTLHSLRLSPSRSKIPFHGLLYGGSRDFIRKSPLTTARYFWNKGDELSPTTMNTDAEGFLLDSISKSFSEGVWPGGFYSPRQQEEKVPMLESQSRGLQSDRCEVSDDAKQKIVSSIVEALSDLLR